MNLGSYVFLFIFSLCSSALDHSAIALPPTNKVSSDFQEWKKKDALQRLCMMRALRPDRMTYAVQTFVEEKLGPKYVENRSVEFAKSFEESGSNPAPIISIKA